MESQMRDQKHNKPCHKDHFSKKIPFWTLAKEKCIYHRERPFLQFTQRYIKSYEAGLDKFSRAIYLFMRMRKRWGGEGIFVFLYRTRNRVIDSFLVPIPLTSVRIQ